MRAVARRRGHAFAYTTTSYPSRTRWTDMQQLIRYCRSSNIIVRLLKEEKSQAQPEHGSCERLRGGLV